MSDERADRCYRCQFWELYKHQDEMNGNHPDDQTGACNRYPPTLDIVEILLRRDEGILEYADRFFVRIETSGSDWCGEFQLRKGDGER